jgi:hypothetical protein
VKLRKLTKKLDKFVKEASEEDVLQAAMVLFQRIGLRSQLLQPEPDAPFTHQQIYLVCGDSYVATTPSEFEWPLALYDATIPEKDIN